MYISLMLTKFCTLKFRECALSKCIVVSIRCEVFIDKEYIVRHTIL